MIAWGRIAPSTHGASQIILSLRVATGIDFSPPSHLPLISPSVLASASASILGSGHDRARVALTTYTCRILPTYACHIPPTRAVPRDASVCDSSCIASAQGPRAHGAAPRSGAADKKHTTAFYRYRSTTCGA